VPHFLEVWPKETQTCTDYFRLQTQLEMTVDGSGNDANGADAHRNIVCVGRFVA
jgi:hypothetical protein